MLILLPPSEGKNSPSRAKKLSFSALSFANCLTPTRQATLKKYSSVDISKCDAAVKVYSGVLYQALDYQSLSATAQKRADKSIVIISAAFGALRLFDVIPFYKFKISPALWKKPLAEALDGLESNLIVDCRSSTYATVWSPPADISVGIRIFTRVNGKKKTITHMSKKYRGEVVRYLVKQSKAPQSPRELYTVLKREFNCQLIKPEGKKSWFIDVTVEPQ